MTSDQTHGPTPKSPAPDRRYSAAVVVGAGLIGVTLGALAVFALATPTWKIRVELPPPPYPAPLTSTPLSSYLPPSPPAVSTTPTSQPGSSPAPPLPPPPLPPPPP